MSIPKINEAWSDHFKGLPAGSVRMLKPKCKPAPWSWMGELFGKSRVYSVEYTFVVEPQEQEQR